MEPIAYVLGTEYWSNPTQVDNNSKWRKKQQHGRKCTEHA